MNGDGSIVDISCVHGSIANDRLVAGTARKGALDTVTRTLAVDWGTAGHTGERDRPGYLERDLTAALEPTRRWGEFCARGPRSGVSAGPKSRSVGAVRRQRRVKLWDRAMSYVYGPDRVVIDLVVDGEHQAATEDHGHSGRDTDDVNDVNDALGASF